MKKISMKIYDIKVFSVSRTVGDSILFMVPLDNLPNRKQNIIHLYMKNGNLYFAKEHIGLK